MLGALGLQLVSKYSSAAFQIVLAIVLARLLTPEEFGLVAIVTVFSTLFNVMADIGIGTAIVQYDDLSVRDYRGLFFFTGLVGLVLGGIFALLSNAFAFFYKSDELIYLSLLMSPSVLFNAMNMVPNGLLLKNHLFRIIAARTIVVTFGCGCIAILLASCGFGAYSLVVNAVLTSILILIWNWKCSGLGLPSIHFIDPVKRVFRYSAFQALFGFLNYFARNLDNILVGYFMGATQLGYYDKSYRLMTYPNTYLTGIFSSVLQPYLAKKSAYKEAIYAYWIKLCKLLAFIGGFVTVVFFCCADEIIFILFGEQWLPAAPALQGLSISLALQMINSTSGAIFQSTWHTDYLFKCGLINTGISIVVIVAACFSNSIEFLAYAVSIAYIMHFLVTGLFLPGKVFDKSLWAYIREFIPQIICIIITVCLVIFLEQVANSLCGLNPLATGFVKVGAVTFCYTICGLLLKQFSLFGVLREMKTM